MKKDKKKETKKIDKIEKKVKVKKVKLPHFGEENGVMTFPKGDHPRNVRKQLEA